MQELNNPDTQWLSLSDYSSTYQVSVSTLRRRIKSNQLPYKMISGKYFLSPPSQDSQDIGLVNSQVAETARLAMQSADFFEPSVSEDILTEIKGLYKNSLQDKEEQILILKQQVTDLKTLVMFLERENERLLKPDF